MKEEEVLGIVTGTAKKESIGRSRDRRAHNRVAVAIHLRCRSLGRALSQGQMPSTAKIGEPSSRF